SLHAEGRRARAVLDGARDCVAAALGAKRGEIVFTGSGTESDNQAILGVARAFRRPAHVIASAIEHHAVLAALEQLKSEGFDTTLLRVESDGTVRPETFAQALRSDTLLASIMYVNNEIGTVQPITDLARIARQRGVLFHCDAIQAPSWLPIDVRELGVDLLSLSAHKFGGPKGVGVLYVRDGTAVTPLVHGGGQESGRRAGTENVAGAAGLAAALELAAAERAEKGPRVAALRERLEEGICSTVPDVRVNGAAGPRSANIANVSFASVDSDALLIALDLAGIAVSAGSACTSGTLEPSHVLGALALDPAWTEGAIRFSLGSATTPMEVERTIAVLPGLIGRLRGNG
ncbi:MAG TPA: cysteine desulfurase family protein, partial [Candidatus Cybelea sp.]